MKCERCGVEFIKPKKPSEAKRRKYCGKACSLEAIHDGQKIPLKDRFWIHVNKIEKEECWEWQRRKSSNGYGLISGDDRRTMQAHRVAYELKFGEIPDGLIVRHKCDNPLCCNPSHLETGTQSDNIMDMMVRSRCAAVKISNEVVSKIHAEFIGGLSTKEIAENHGLNRSSVKQIIRRGRVGFAAPVSKEIRKANGVKNQLKTRFENGFIGENGKRAAEIVFGAKS